MQKIAFVESKNAKVIWLKWWILKIFHLFEWLQSKNNS